VPDEPGAGGIDGRDRCVELPVGCVGYRAEVARACDSARWCSRSRASSAVMHLGGRAGVTIRGVPSAARPERSGYSVRAWPRDRATGFRGAVTTLLGLWALVEV
jgi:hypothetical protein